MYATVQKLFQWGLVGSLFIGLSVGQGHDAYAAAQPSPVEQSDASVMADWGSIPTPSPTERVDDPDKPPLVDGSTPLVPTVIDQRESQARAAAVAAPTITLWYGDSQTFGHIGAPQTQVNLLGNIAVPVGTTVTDLRFSLNDGDEHLLNIGPDQRRLAELGDFNIEIESTELISGLNTVMITGTDSLGDVAVKTVTVTYETGQTWPVNYTIDWSTVTNLQDVAQVVDGLWAVQDDVLRPLTLHYDRLIAIGDVSWSDYEVTVPLTIHSIDTSGFSGPSNGAGIGIIARWKGHFAIDDTEQPHTGWRRLGALGWYRWAPNNTVGMEMRANTSIISSNSTKQLEFGVPYIMKMSVQSADSGPSFYRFKVWQADFPEPALWDLQGVGKVGELSIGSLLLVAHHVDASFGNVTVTPLTEITPKLQVDASTGGKVTVQPLQDEYAYGQLVRLDAISDPGFAFQGWGGDISGALSTLNLDITQDLSVSAIFDRAQTDPITSTVPSDDFNSCTLGTGWELTAPDPESGLEMTGTQLLIRVPAGTEHNVWVNNNLAPRVLQPIDDTDFEIEVKFESTLNQRYQVQGIIIEQDDKNFLRFDFHRFDQTTTRAFSASFRETPSGGMQVTNTIVAVVTPPGTDSYIRVRRVGNIFTHYYSFDGENWTANGNFAYNMTATKAGVFAGNAGSNPEFTAIVDYFFNTSDPVDPEDGKPTTVAVNIEPTGQGNVGSVAVTPEKTIYTCADEVTVTAQPASGWKLDSWSGTVSGSASSATFAYTPGASVTATFVRDQERIFLPLVSK